MTDELLAEFEFELSEYTLVPSKGGLFEVWIDDELIYSKKANKRHAEPGEILGLAGQIINSQSGG